MKIYSIFLIAFFSFSCNLWANIQDKKLSNANETWQGYLNCAKKIDVEIELINCLYPYLSGEITRLDKSKIASFLIMQYSFSLLRICDINVDQMPTRMGKNEEVFCMDVLGNKSKTAGFVIFEKNKKHYNPKIKAIKYSF